MRIYSKHKSSAIRKAVAWTLIALLAACGNGTQTSTSDSSTPGSNAKLAATTTAVALVTPASYTVTNIGTGFDIAYRDNRVLNNNGQVVGSILISGLNIRQAVRFDGGTFTLLGSLGNGNNFSFATAINDKGQVTGTSDNGNAIHAFLYNGANMIDLGALENASHTSKGTAINSNGQVTGYSSNGIVAQTFLYNGSAMMAVGAARFLNDDKAPPSINAIGQVTGYSVTNKFQSAFLYNGTNLISLGNLGFEKAQFYGIAINANGQVTGTLFDGLFTHAFLYNGTAMIDLGALGTGIRFAYGNAINDSGQVTGEWFNSNAAHAFLFDGATMTDLGTLGSTLNTSKGHSINASGQIVGKSQTTGNAERAFIKSPADSQMIDLNTLLTNAPGVELFDAVAISDSGYILAEANTGWVLLKPAVAMPEPAPATLGAITANDPVAVSTPVNVSGLFSDINTNDRHTAQWKWEGNGTSTTSPGTVTEPNGTDPGTITGSTVFSAAGLYNVTLSVTDGSIAPPSTVSRQIVVYDPSAGFVTGGGWIISPAGAYKADERMTGRATFGFVSKYLKGANKPAGETAFQFQASGLNFYSNNYDWLVVGGARAQYKGSGTINGTGSYQFMLTAVDGDLIAKGTPDRFRIRIWHHDDATNTDVTDYDNQIDSSVAGSNLEGTVLGGGSINVKTR